MIIETSQLLLEEAGYFVVRRPDEHGSLLFEDDAVLGLLLICPSVEFIFSEWQHRQDAFLREFASALRRSPDKAWNTYLAMLTGEEPSVMSRRRLSAIEEDFSGMRKIAAAGVLSAEDVSRALAPLLPLKPLTVENESFIARLKTAVPLDDNGFAALLAGDVEQLVSILLEERR